LNNSRKKVYDELSHKPFFLSQLESSSPYAVEQGPYAFQECLAPAANSSGWLMPVGVEQAASVFLF